MNTVKLIGSVLMTTILGTHSVFAEGGRAEAYHQGPYTDLAKVVEVQPIRTTFRVATPRRECWEEEVQYRHSGYHQGRSYTPTILGGIIGGVVGNQFGKGDGNTLMTVAGALLGGSVGNDHGRYHRSHERYGGYSTVETRCTVRTEYHDEERIDGYRVQYLYQGRLYTTRMNHHPGDQIRVNVNVTPAY